MTAQISESNESRPFTLGKSARREILYTVTGTEDETEVAALVYANSPAAYLGLLRESIDAEPQGGGVWKCRVSYSLLENNNEYTFDTGGGTTKVTQSLGTTAYAGAYGVAPDFNGAIGVDGDKVEGVDITSPAYEFSETHYFTDSDVTLAYKLAVFQLTSRVNIATFRGFAAGECLFMGCSGSKRGDEQWSITYRFSCSPNATGITVGSISGIDKRGWDYMWVRYDDFADSSAFSLVKRPVAVYVEKVYYDGDFSTLGIGA